MITGTKEECETQVAQIINRKVQEGKKIIGIVGGRSVKGIYEQLDLKGCEIFFIDEREVPLDSEESNYNLVKGMDNVHPYDYTKGVHAYGNELSDYGGKFDLVIVSAGEDGHIGGLFPNHHSVQNRTTGFIRMDDSPKLPKQRMTASRKLLETAQVGIVVFFGKGKRKALETFQNESISVEHCPAKIIKNIPEWYVVTDL